MNCPDCRDRYSFVANVPKIICSNKHVVCNNCALSPKSSVCGRCSEPILNSPYTCHLTLGLLREPTKYTIVSFAVIGLLLGYLYSKEGFMKTGLKNFKYYFLVVCTDFIVRQLMIVFCEVLPQVLYLRRNPEKNKVGIDYLAEVLLRQALLWNARKMTVWKFLLMVAKYVAFGLNFQYVIKNEPELGALGIVSTVVTALSLPELPIIKQIIGGLITVIVKFFKALGFVLSKISALLCTLVVFAVYAALGGLGFFGYMFEAEMFKLRGRTLDLEPALFALPYLIHREIQKKDPQEKNWLAVAFYHNLALWLTRYVRYSIVTDILISLICVPKLILIPLYAVLTMATGDSFDNYHDLGVDVSAGLSVLLTPLQVTLFMLMPYINA